MIGYRSRSLLQTLDCLNQADIYPSKSKLVEIDNGLSSMPRRTAGGRFEIVTRMMAKGWIRHQTDETGYVREYCLVITDSGRDILKES